MTSGLSDEEVEALVAWPEGPRLFEHLRDIERPFQVADLPGYFASLGFPPGPWPTRTMQGAPMRHRGEHVGTFFVGDKADGEAFTPEDEEILVGMNRSKKTGSPHDRADGQGYLQGTRQVQSELLPRRLDHVGNDVLLTTGHRKGTEAG